MTTSAKATTNTEIKSAIDALCHRFDMFEQKEESRHVLLECDVKDLKETVYGNGKEGLKSIVKMLKDSYDSRMKRGDAIWIGVAMIVINALAATLLR